MNSDSTKDEEGKSDEHKILESFPKCLKNPFLDRFIVKTKKKTVAVSKQSLLLQNVETEQEGIAFISIREEVEKNVFMKVYMSYIHEIFKLNSQGFRVLEYFWNALKYDNDRVLFIMSDCLKTTKYKSSRSVYNGIIELLNKEFIARTENKNVYYINLNIFFNGNRLVVVKEYIAKNGTETKLSDSIEDPLQLKILDKPSKKTLK